MHLLLLACFFLIAQHSRAETNSTVDAQWSKSVYALPQASARRANDQFSFTIGKGQPVTFREAGKALNRILSTNGFVDIGWIPYRNSPLGSKERVGPVDGSNGELIGFVGFTKVEQFDRSGRPLEGEERWNTTDARGGGRKSSFLSTLFKGAPDATYRSFAIAISLDRLRSVPQRALPNVLDNGPLSLEEISAFRISGSRIIPELQNVNRSSTSSPRSEMVLTVFVYEYRRSSVSGELSRVRESKYGIDFHLRGSNLIALFE